MTPEEKPAIEAIEVEATPIEDPTPNPGSDTPGENLIPHQGEPTRLEVTTAEDESDTVTISQAEYLLLQKIVIDCGSMVGLMMDIQGVFTGFMDGQELSLGTIGRMILAKPGKFKKAAEALAKPVIGMAPFIQKYGPSVKKMTNIEHERANEDSSNLPVSGVESNA